MLSVARAQEMDRTTARLVRDLDARQCAEQVELCAHIGAELAELDAHGAELAGWASSSGARLGQRADDVKRFIDEELVVYLPTGQPANSRRC